MRLANAVHHLEVLDHGIWNALMARMTNGQQPLFWAYTFSFWRSHRFYLTSKMIDVCIVHVTAQHDCHNFMHCIVGLVCVSNQWRANRPKRFLHGVMVIDFHSIFFFSDFEIVHSSLSSSPPSLPSLRNSWVTTDVHANDTHIFVDKLMTVLLFPFFLLNHNGLGILGFHVCHTSGSHYPIGGDENSWNVLMNLSPSAESWTKGVLLHRHRHRTMPCRSMLDSGKKLSEETISQPQRTLLTGVDEENVRHFQDQ